MAMPIMSRAQHRMFEVKPGEFSPDKLVDAMRDAEYNPQELADEMGASVEAVARWMAGIAVPKPGYLKQAARVLEVNINKLFD